MIFWRERAQQRLQRLPPIKVNWPLLAAEKKAAWEKKPATLVFVDGFFVPELSLPPADVVCQSLDVALKTYSLFFQNRWTKTLQGEQDVYYLFNAKDHGRGLFLYVPPHVHSSLHVYHLTTGSELASPKIEIALGKGSSLSFVQTVQGGYCNGVVECTLDEGAHLKAYNMALLPDTANLRMTWRNTLKRDAHLSLFHATNGAKSSHLSLNAQLTEENSSFHFSALTMLYDQRQAHISSQADHAAPYSVSQQHIKTVLNGQSQSSFEGKIYVRPIAQKTESYQLNNHLLLSEEAKASSKPNLEIFADDVKASHGATFSQISSEELFYLCSRGLPLVEAKSLLLQGFCRTLIDKIELDFLKPLLFDAMAQV